MAVRVGKLPNRFGPGPKTHPVITGFTNINVSTSNTGQWRNLSPMIMGPFTFLEPIVPNPWFPTGIYPGFERYNQKHQIGYSTNMENWWQGAKIYKEDLLNIYDGIQVSDTFYNRWAKLRADPKPHRRALPKDRGVPIAGFCDGRSWEYIPSRKYYFDMYQYLLSNLPVARHLYTTLVERRKNGENIHIIGYDGRDIGEVTLESLKAAYADPSFPFGHELVLASLLSGFSWKDLV